ncbi:MAG: CARDB domain-containing protein, partial [Candidatus Micrarchaeota archaeon]
APSKPNTVTHVTKPVGSSDFYIPILAPGAQSSNSLAFNCPSAGTYYLEATADYTNIDVEFDENNGKMKGFTCKNPGANLVVSMSFQNSGKKSMGIVSISTRNVGTGPAGPSQTRAGSSIFNIPSLAAGAQVTNSKSVTCTYGIATLTSTADVGNTVPEGNELDNIANGRFNCEPNSVNNNLVAKGYDIEFGGVVFSPYVLAVIISLLIVGAWYVSQNSKNKGKKR